MKIAKPIFIIGTGRSGTTMVHEILCEHPNLSWFSVLLSRFPDETWLNRLFMYIIDWPLLGRFLRKYIIPTESYQFWDYYAKGFGKPYRDLKASDVTIKVQNRLPKVFGKTMAKKRNRLLIKITGWPRIEYILKIFPDAIFIHIKRDPRAIVNSFLNVYFWKGWEGPEQWRWGKLSDEQRKEWEKHDESFVALAAIGYKKMHKVINRSTQKLKKHQFLEISYEAICDKPQKEFDKILEFAGLGSSKRFNRYIAKQNIRNTNLKWEMELTDEQKKILNEVLEPVLDK